MNLEAMHQRWSTTTKTPRKYADCTAEELKNIALSGVTGVCSKSLVAQKSAADHLTHSAKRQQQRVLLIDPMQNGQSKAARENRSPCTSEDDLHLDSSQYRCTRDEDLNFTAV